MYLAKKNRKKLLLSSLLILQVTISLITGRTIASSLILMSYPTSILPYYYFSQALLMIISAKISRVYLQKSEKKFAIIFKLIILGLLLFFMFTLSSGLAFIPFCISVFILTYIAITSLIAWNYASEIFDLQEYKQFSKILQLSSSVGAIFAGVLLGILTAHYTISSLLGLLFVVELMGLFLIAPLARYVIPVKPVKKHRELFVANKKNTLSKYLALITLATALLATLIDYNLKLGVVAAVDKQNIAHVFSIIFVISTTTVLVIQLFFLDLFFRFLGSKKIIVICPLAILFTAIMALFFPNFIFIAALYIVNEVANNTTATLSRNLYLNVLPQAKRLLDRVRLKGVISPLAVIISSFIVLGMTYVTNKSQFILVLIVLISVIALYMAKILIAQYRVQLVQSLYLRRFNRDLINKSVKDDKDIVYLLNEALNYPDPEAVLFGLQLLRQHASLNLPGSLATLLLGDNPNVVNEVAKILAYRRSQRQFVNAAITVFLATKDENTKWNLALYLMDPNFKAIFSQVYFKENTGVLLAIESLFALKHGDLEQHIKAMQSLLDMYSSRNSALKKWFLLVLDEIQDLDTGSYLSQFIEKGSTLLKTLAIQQIKTTSDAYLLEVLIKHLGEAKIAYVLHAGLMRIGDRAVAAIENRFNNASSYQVKLACIRVLSTLKGNQAEYCLRRLLTQNADGVIKTVAAKYIAYRGVSSKISEPLQDFLEQFMRVEIAHYFYLSDQLKQYASPLIRVEINSRKQLIKKRVLYYAAALMGSADILNSVPLFSSSNLDKNQKAIALELIDTTINDRKIALLLMALFSEKKIKEVVTYASQEDPWLRQYIRNIESNTMDSIYTLTQLRKVNLFKNLAAETLQVLVECCSSRDMSKGEVIFAEGDEGDGLYIVDSGEVAVTKNGVLIATLSECDYFGELALLADIPRFATVTANSEGALFYIDKQDFDKITDEIPEIMRSINRQVIEYLVADVSVMARS